jgi:Tfp pilus assembly protein PilN
MAEIQRITAKQAEAKARECRQMAKHSKNPDHQAMLEQMAEAWERIAGDQRRMRMN